MDWQLDWFVMAGSVDWPVRAHLVGWFVMALLLHSPVGAGLVEECCWVHCAVVGRMVSEWVPVGSMATTCHGHHRVYPIAVGCLASSSSQQQQWQHVVP